MEKIRVVAFDDFADIRDMYELLINGEEDMICAGTFPDCNNVIKHIEQTLPDVILMDIAMPGLNGIESVRLIMAKFPELKVIMQTVFEDGDRIFDAICAGASGYILKKSTPEQIVQAIRDAYVGGSPMTPLIAAKVLEQLRMVTPVKKAPEDFRLTEREKELLQLLVKGMSYKMIAVQLKISYHTVDSHIRKIYEKLHVHSATEAIGKALERRVI